MRNALRLSRFLVAIVAAALAMPAPFALAAGDRYDDEYDGAPRPSRVARINHLDGEASVRRPDTGHWQDADRNMAMFAADEYYTPDGSRVEVKLGGGR